MSLPRRRAAEHRPFQQPASFPHAPDFSVIMPAIRKLREAGKDQFALEIAIDEIPSHLYGQIAIFAGERHDMLPWPLVRMLLDAVGIDALCRDVGQARAATVWRRYHAKE